MKFCVVAERSAGLLNGNGERIRNPFKIRDVFDPILRARTERRTWESVEAKDEAEVRRLFAEAVKENINDMRGFVLVSVTPDAR
jgi:hypothetical protein